MRAALGAHGLLVVKFIYNYQPPRAALYHNGFRVSHAGRKSQYEEPDISDEVK